MMARRGERDSGGSDGVKGRRCSLVLCSATEALPSSAHFRIDRRFSLCFCGRSAPLQVLLTRVSSYGISRRRGGGGGQFEATRHVVEDPSSSCCRPAGTKRQWRTHQTRGWEGIRGQYLIPLTHSPLKGGIRTRAKQRLQKHDVYFIWSRCTKPSPLLPERFGRRRRGKGVSVSSPLTGGQHPPTVLPPESRRTRGGGTKLDGFVFRRVSSYVCV